MVSEYSRTPVGNDALIQKGLRQALHTSFRTTSVGNDALIQKGLRPLLWRDNPPTILLEMMP